MEDSSINIVYDIAMKRLDAQIEEIEGIDKKLRSNLQLASLIIAVPITFLSIRSIQITPLILSIFSLILLDYLCILALTSFGYGLAKLPYLANIRDIRDNLLEKPSIITKLVIIDVMIHNVEENHKTTLNKAKIYRFASILQLVLLFVAVIFLVRVALN